MVCIENLHPFDLDPNTDKVACPVCGCKAVRRDKTSPDVPMAGPEVPEVTVRVMEGRHLVGGETWLDSPATLRGVASKLAPELVDTDDLKKGVEKWFAKETDNG